jgi:hypothetical protein
MTNAKMSDINPNSKNGSHLKQKKKLIKQKFEIRAFYSFKRNQS